MQQIFPTKRFCVENSLNIPIKVGKGYHGQDCQLSNKIHPVVDSDRAIVWHMSRLIASLPHGHIAKFLLVEQEQN